MWVLFWSRGERRRTSGSNKKQPRVPDAKPGLVGYCVIHGKSRVPGERSVSFSFVFADFWVKFGNP